METGPLEANGMDTGRTEANGIEIAFDAFGAPSDPPLVLIMGVGVPRFGWDEDLCRLLAGRGFRVIRFDNRDAGESTHLHDAPRPDLAAAYARDFSSAAYRLEDMADDTAGLLDALGIDSAHVVGASMGGMIAQTLVIHHRERVRSLTSIMSTASPAIGAPREDILPVLLEPAGRTQPEHEEMVVRTWSVIGSPGFRFDEQRIRELARRTWEAGYDPKGFLRQLLAILASGSRVEALRGVDVPALVIHGDADPLVQLPGGQATAEALPGAELEVIEGMGHDLPVELYDFFADRITALARRTDAERLALS